MPAKLAWLEVGKLCTVQEYREYGSHAIALLRGAGEESQGISYWLYIKSDEGSDEMHNCPLCITMLSSVRIRPEKSVTQWVEYIS